MVFGKKVGETYMAKGKYKEWLEPDSLIKLEGWARDGLTDEQIADKIGINKATLYRWKSNYCDICNALKKGKDIIDRQVENALLKRALGYEYDEVTQEIAENGKLKITKVITKEVVPDTTAQIFWLKNRKPDDWRDKREHKNDVSVKADDGFLEALTLTAKSDWDDEEDG